MTITNAQQSDAPLIGKAVVMAIGPELARDFAGAGTVEDVEALLGRLAARTDSQYSYCNTLKAIDADGNTMGFVVAYDGARLHQLRRSFIAEVRRAMGHDLEGRLSDECEAGEYYLDTLAVFESYRGRGVAKALIEAAAGCAHNAGKPLGLLCAKDNGRARRLYDSCGFRQDGERTFAGELMDHLLL